MLDVQLRKDQTSAALALVAHCKPLSCLDAERIVDRQQNDELIIIFISTKLVDTKTNTKDKKNLTRKT